jgi:[ribosomal protein S5]-alanine N-acetyltransferase
MWIIIEKRKRSIIGGICFHGEPDENGEVEIGYGTDGEYRNQGYMTETVEGLVIWLRNNKKVKIIKAETDNDNISSARVLEKNGFKVQERNDASMIFGLGLK